MLRILNPLKLLMVGFCFLMSLATHAQDSFWPRDIVLDNGIVITIFAPQPEKLEGNKLTGRAAIAVRMHPDSSQHFGAIFATALLETNRELRTALLEKLTVNNVRFPGTPDDAKIAELKKIIEEELPTWDLVIPLDILVTSLEEKPNASGSGFNNAPPVIIYADTPSLLISIIGEPRIQKEEGSQIERVVNTPFPILKNGPFFYILAGGYWYRSRNVKSGWQSVTVANLSAPIKEIDADIKRQQKEQEKETGEPVEKTDGPVSIIVVTQPTELIQTSGLPVYNSIEGTSLLYVSNTTSDIFKDIESQKIYLLLAGRWFASPTMQGPWEYIPADKLPSDFSDIPYESENGDILANVGGTEQAQDAILDAMIPQTAKVYRKDAKLDVVYDGAPVFEPITGTSMKLAMNTATTVFQANGRFFALDNGIWFVSDRATGPWVVSDERPEEVTKVPSDCKAYNAQHVHVFESQPDHVLTGFTQGYTQSYVQGPTIVYGTGWMPSPWMGPMFFPPPMIWGFGFRWHPWWGWSMGFGFRVNMFWGMGGMRVGVGFGMGMGMRVGFFGPPMFRPPIVVVGVGRRPGMGGWGRPGIGGGNNNNINIGGGGGNTINIGNGNGNNIYNNRPGVVNNNRGDRPANRPGAGGVGANNTRPGTGVNRPDAGGNRPGTGVNRPEVGGNRPGTGGNRPETGTRPGGENRPSRESRPSRETNNVITDRNGDVYRRDQNGNWNQRNGNNWQQNNRNNNQQLDRMQQGRDRSNTRQNSYQPPRPNPGAGARPGGNTRPATNNTRPPGGGNVRPTTPSRPPSGGGARPATPSRPPSGGGARPATPSRPPSGGGARPATPSRPPSGGARPSGGGGGRRG